MLNGLDLFSGIGGISLALSQWVRPIAYCERDRYAQAVLLSRMRDGQLPSAPIWDDVTTLVSELLPGSEIDIIYGGFPCQDISLAGSGAGLDGDRSGLFREILRLAGDLRPSFIFLENVPAITTRGLDRVLMGITALGYDSRWTVVSAAEIGAHHQRERWFLLAHANGKQVRLPEPGERNEAVYASSLVGNGQDPDADGKGVEIRRPQVGLGKKQPFGLDLLEGNDWDEYASFFLRVDHGVPNRSHRIRGLGNAVVPIQARAAFKRLCGLK